jgi:oligopeptide/dipeptide ABC transporter ATP-binding protein
MGVVSRMAPTADNEDAQAIGESPMALEVRNLRTWFPGTKNAVRAVDGVSFAIKRGEVRCLVGESGCGKSVAALSIMGLVRRPGEVLSGSSIKVNGRELTSLREREYRRVRGSQIGMIFQDPMSSLNPAYRIGWQIAEAARLHAHLTRAEALRRAIELMELVGIPAASARAHDYPYQLSGGMRQRIMIAMALVTRPSVIIADEPTTALDVTIQAQILELLQSVRREFNTAILLITHDFAVVGTMADRVDVMYAGRIVESGTRDEVLERPKHPYSRALLASVPVLGMNRRQRLQGIPGTVPSWSEELPGCRFAPRCEHAFDQCTRDEPELEEVEGQMVACWLHVRRDARGGSLESIRLCGGESHRGREGAPRGLHLD